MRRAPVFALVGVFLSTGHPASADSVSDLAAARAHVARAMPDRCDFPDADSEWPERGNHAFSLTFRMPGQDQDTPDRQVRLVQMVCTKGHANVTTLYLLREDDEWTIVSFAAPVVSYDYVDAEFTRLVAPPVVNGFSADTVLMNGSFSPTTGRITSFDSYRSASDTWARGEWAFVDGTFVLEKFSIDPIMASPGSEFEDSAPSETYVVYDAGQAAK